MMDGWAEEYEKVLRAYCQFVPENEPIGPDAPFGALGVDSVSMLGLIVDIEDAFGVAFPLTDLTADVLSSPATLWQAVTALLGDR